MKKTMERFPISSWNPSFRIVNKIKHKNHPCCCCYFIITTLNFVPGVSGDSCTVLTVEKLNLRYCDYGGKKWRGSAKYSSSRKGSWVKEVGKTLFRLRRRLVYKSVDLKFPLFCRAFRSNYHFFLFRFCNWKYFIKI